MDEPGEKVIASWVASIPFKRFDLALEGGTLTLTEDHLLFRTIRVPAAFGDVIRMTGGKVGWSRPLSEISSVEPVEGKRSQLRIETLDGKAKSFIIAAGRLALRGNPDNVEARDEAVGRIREALR